MTMVVIGYDRYNVICKGFNGVKITAGKAFIILIAIWMYSTLGSMPPFLFGWGDYALGKKNFYKVLYLKKLMLCLIVLPLSTRLFEGLDFLTLFCQY